MKISHYFIIAILGTSLIFVSPSVFADIMASNSFLKECDNNTSQIPTLEPQNNNSTGPKQGILVMHSNSVALVCIKYVRPFGWNSSMDINNTKLDNPFPVKVENIHVSGNLISFGSIFVNNVMVKAQPNVISFGSQENASTVISYTLSAKSNSAGYYHVVLPYVCNDILLAVGYDPSQVNASAFQDLDPMCFNYGVKTSIVGVKGANMTYVDHIYESAHSSKLSGNISIIPPLQQVKMFEVSAKSIQCNIGLQLILKSENNTPACVKPDTANILVERGWTKPT
jgi:hypothetical protein